MLGMIVACLIKELKVSTELRKMSEIQLVSDNTISSLIKQKFESPLKKRPDDDDPFIKGEFDVIKELVAKVINDWIPSGRQETTYLNRKTYFRSPVLMPANAKLTELSICVDPLPKVLDFRI